MQKEDTDLSECSLLVPGPLVGVKCRSWTGRLGPGLAV
jgi:hypothetical protein